MQQQPQQEPQEEHHQLEEEGHQPHQPEPRPQAEEVKLKTVEKLQEKVNYNLMQAIIPKII
jgi:hypothetical protein